MMLADAGSDVLKVEPPTSDDSRGWLPVAERDEERESAYSLSANRGKRSVRLDLKTAGGTGRLRELAGRADVLVENYRPGLLDRFGLRLDGLREDDPRLTTLSITGFGTGGPDGHRSGPSRHRHQHRARGRGERARGGDQQGAGRPYRRRGSRGLLSAGVPAGRIRAVPEVYEWDQVRHLGLQGLQHPRLGPINVPGAPLMMGACRWRLVRHRRRSATTTTASTRCGPRTTKTDPYGHRMARQHGPTG